MAADENIYKSSDNVINSRSGIPFNILKPGQSVFRYIGEVKEGSLRAAVSAASNKHPEHCFKVFKHKQGYFEIACFTKIENEVDQTAMIVESSEQAKTFNDGTFKANRKYPFAELPEGMSFLVPIPVGKEAVELAFKSLRTACTVQSKKLNRRFILLKHEMYGMFEVYSKPNETLTFYQPSEQAKASE